MTNQTARVMELIRRFNKGEVINIDILVKEANEDYEDYIENLWINKNAKEDEKCKAISEKTIRRDLDVIKHFFPDTFETIRAGKGEKASYKAITKKSFDNFIKPDVMSLMVQTFNLANKSDLFDNFDLDSNDKKILESKIKETNNLYEFKNKPFESKKDDLVIFKELERAIKHQKCLFIEYFLGESTKRYEVRPYKIVFMQENFYLACGVDHEDFELSMYRISKIKNLEESSKTFQKNIEILDYIKNMQTPFSVYRKNYKEYLIDVELEVHKSKVFYFNSKKHLKSQSKGEVKQNGNTIFTFKVTQDKEMEELIKKWIPYVKVIKPLSLKNTIKKQLEMYLLDD